MAIKGENMQIELIFRRNLPEGFSTMGARWSRNGHETGVWVKYDVEYSHKEGFSMLCQGIWDAINDPDGYNIEQESREGTEPEPYWDGAR